MPISQRMPVMLARSDPADDGDQTSEQEHTAEEQQHPTRDKRTERVGAREPAPSRQHRSGDGDDRAEDESVFAAICRLPRQGGALTVLVSLTARDGRAPLTNVDVARVSHACRRRGFSLVLRRDIARTDVDLAHSSLGKAT